MIPYIIGGLMLGLVCIVGVLFWFATSVVQTIELFDELRGE